MAYSCWKAWRLGLTVCPTSSVEGSFQPRATGRSHKPLHNGHQPARGANVAGPDEQDGSVCGVQRGEQLSLRYPTAESQVFEDSDALLARRGA